MLSVEEMRKVLAEQFNIRTNKELEEALNKIGGIRIGIFVDKPKHHVQAIVETA